jgi:hypothetical protein
MKVSKKTLALMATGGVIVSPIIVDQAIKQVDPDDGLIERVDRESRGPSLSDRYYRAEYKVRALAIKYGLLPPPPPCGVCGMG